MVKASAWPSTLWEVQVNTPMFARGFCGETEAAATHSTMIQPAGGVAALALSAECAKCSKCPSGRPGIFRVLGLPRKNFPYPQLIHPIEHQPQCYDLR